MGQCIIFIQPINVMNKCILNLKLSVKLDYVVNLCIYNFTYIFIFIGYKFLKNLLGLSPLQNFTDRATTAFRRS
jgi:hypothetical protein